MSKFVFLFELDAIVTKENILLTISKETGVYDQMLILTKRVNEGAIPFKKSFLSSVEMLQNIPVNKVCQMVDKIPLNLRLVDFIQRNKERCYIATTNLDAWIEILLEKLSMEKNTFCSKTLVINNALVQVASVLDKKSVINQMALPIVAVGNSNNDAEMMEMAEIGIGYGGVCEIAPAVLNCASHAIYNEKKLVEFLNRLL